MDFDKLCTTVFEGLKPVLESHPGLGVYARERSRFDGWLQVELVRVLQEKGLKPEPDKDKADVALGAWGLAVRSINTNIPCDQAQSKTRPIAKNIETLVKDIWKLTNPGRSSAFSKRAILFAVFPTTHDNERWQDIHFRRIRDELNRVEHLPFEFSGGVSGVIYLGLCSETQ